MKILKKKLSKNDKINKLKTKNKNKNKILKYKFILIFKSNNFQNDLKWRGCVYV